MILFWINVFLLLAGLLLRQLQPKEENVPAKAVSQSKTKQPEKERALQKRKTREHKEENVTQKRKTREPKEENVTPRPAKAMELRINCSHIKLAGGNKTKTLGPGADSAVGALACSGMKIGGTENEMSIIPINIDHKCHEHYAEKNYQALFTCEGCKMDGYGMRFECKLCKGTALHPMCRYTRSTITHKIFPGSTFTFVEKPHTKFCKECKVEYYSKCCNACRKDICGFSYRCEKLNKDLHPNCINLPNKRLIGETILNLKSKVSSKCRFCNMKDVRGWSYVSTCKKYQFHVSCVTDIVLDALMKMNDNESAEMALQKVDLGKLAKSRGKAGRAIFRIVKFLVKAILSAVLGDPSGMAINLVTELVLPRLDLSKD